jgi:hypothetical protein
VNLTASFGVTEYIFHRFIMGWSSQFVYCSDNFDGNLYASKRKNNTWSKLEN